MHIAAKGDEERKGAFFSKGIPPGVTIQWAEAGDTLASVEADAYFDLLFDNNFLPANEFITGKPVFVSAVTCTAKEIGHPNYIRLNGWSGFLERPVIEVAAMHDAIKPAAENILQAFGWQYTWAPDEPGMIAARVISMIINEAYFGLADGISTREEIDIAMKLGTNYPYGPFEWAAKIGVENIYFLLKKLQKQYGDRYQPSGLLEQEVLNNGVTA